MYFARLAVLKPAVEKVAQEAWSSFAIGNDTVYKVDRVLDVRQGELVWVTGTIYMEMPLKPNILDDISKDHWIAAPPPRAKFTSPDGSDQVMLEDESGRLRLTGNALQACLLVTGCIVAVMGTENANGDFEVLDMKVPDLPRQPQRWERDDGNDVAKGKKKATKRPEAGKIAVVSGLEISGDMGDALTLDLLMEYLLGEAATPSEQQQASRISRLIIAGNSLSHASPIPSREEVATRKGATIAPGAARKYGYDASSYNSAPTDRLDQFLATLLPSIPITLIPGDQDPTQTSLPQQPLHAALLPHTRTYMTAPDSEECGWLDSVTNPWEADVDGWRVLVTGGQNVDDVFRYVEGEDRMEMMEAICRWRLSVPTAPDTLCESFVLLPPPFQPPSSIASSSSPHHQSYCVYSLRVTEVADLKCEKGAILSKIKMHSSCLHPLTYSS